tara:strand:+ start:234563 stop:235249 length:687 start_codon:yes stop_codon:yes gene_type:complete
MNQRKLHRVRSILLVLACVSALNVFDASAAGVEFDKQVPQCVFAATELKAAMKEANRENMKISLVIAPNIASAEAFQIRVAGPNEIHVTGADANGVMYGGIEVAEFLKLGLPIENVDRTPLLQKRGLKMNIPWDCRTPSYCDKGSAAQKNIINVWDFDGFWAPYFDGLARSNLSLPFHRRAGSLSGHTALLINPLITKAHEDDSLTTYRPRCFAERCLDCFRSTRICG